MGAFGVWLFGLGSGSHWPSAMRAHSKRRGAARAQSAMELAMWACDPSRMGQCLQGAAEPKGSAAARMGVKDAIREGLALCKPSDAPAFGQAMGRLSSRQAVELACWGFIEALACLRAGALGQAIFLPTPCSMPKEAALERHLALLAELPALGNAWSRLALRAPADLAIPSVELATESLGSSGALMQRQALLPRGWPSGQGSELMMARSLAKALSLCPESFLAVFEGMVDFNLAGCSSAVIEMAKACREAIDIAGVAPLGKKPAAPSRL